jgi:hypothetical protein
VLDELIPSAWHHVEQYANNRIEADHGRLKHWLRPMRGLRTDRTASVVIAGHAFIQNLGRGRYELGLDVAPASRVAAGVHRPRASDLIGGQIAVQPADAPTQRRRQGREKGGEKGPVLGRELHPVSLHPVGAELPLQDGDLMPQSQNLHVLVPVPHR